jgi:NAD-dependent epimerase/dehydratase family protein
LLIPTPQSTLRVTFIERAGTQFMTFRAIITGATGMVGEGVLLECLSHPAVEQILVINRKPGCLSHPKLREIIHANFFNLAPIESQLTGYDACFFCLGVSSVGISQQEYKQITYDLTLNVAHRLAKSNPDMTFCYITGAGTDSSEHGRIAWARVKGAAENALIRLFRRAYMFRPGFMKPTPGQKNVKGYYRWIAWVYPIGRALYPAGFCTLQEVGQAMINTVINGYPQPILEVKDIVQLAKA